LDEQNGWSPFIATLSEIKKHNYYARNRKEATVIILITTQNRFKNCFFTQEKKVLA